MGWKGMLTLDGIMSAFGLNPFFYTHTRPQRAGVRRKTPPSVFNVVPTWHPGWHPGRDDEDDETSLKTEV
eukprot:g21382.t1